MARYDYVCKGCDCVVEVSKSITDVDREERCVKCGTPMRRHYGGSSIVVKYNSSGFHTTDYPTKK